MSTIEHNEQDKSIDQQFTDIIKTLESTQITSGFAANINGKSILKKSKGIMSEVGTFRMAFVKDKKVVTVFPAAGGVLLAIFFPLITLVTMLTLLYRNYTIIMDKK